MEIVFAVVGLGCLFAVALGWALGRASALGDRQAQDAYVAGEDFDAVSFDWRHEDRVA